jgi:hypothetical protein
MKTKCNNWTLINQTTILDDIIDCCLRESAANFIDEPKKWNYYTLRKIGINMFIVEKVTEDCEPIPKETQKGIDLNSLLGWEYCCDFKINVIRDQE